MKTRLWEQEDFVVNKEPSNEFEGEPVLSAMPSEADFHLAACYRYTNNPMQGTVLYDVIISHWCQLGCLPGRTYFLFLSSSFIYGEEKILEKKKNLRRLGTLADLFYPYLMEKRLRKSPLYPCK